MKIIKGNELIKKCCTPDIQKKNDPVREKQYFSVICFGNFESSQ